MSGPDKRIFEEADFSSEVYESLKNPGFKLPEGYFQNKSEDLINLAILSGKPGDPYPAGGKMKVPEAYFEENLERSVRLLHLVKDSGPAVQGVDFGIPVDYFQKAGHADRAMTGRPLKAFLFRTYILKWSAAAVVVISLLSWGLWREATQQEDWAAGVSDEALYAYVEAHAAEYTLENIAEWMSYTEMDVIDVEEEEMEAAEEFLELYN
jgi:hypothetical protein